MYMEDCYTFVPHYEEYFHNHENFFIFHYVFYYYKNMFQLDNSILGSGVVVAGGLVEHSVLARRVRVEEAAMVTDSVLFDHVRVGTGAKLRNCIIDKHVKVPAGEVIGYDLEKDRERFTVSDNGIVVVPRSYRFQDTGVIDEAQGGVTNQSGLVTA